MSKKPLYKEIYDKIVYQIESGEILPDSKLPTEIELAEQHNVSRITATRVYKELADDSYIYKVKGHGSFVKSAKKSNPKSSGGFDFISVILHDNDYSADLLKGIEVVAEKNGYLVTFHNSLNSKVNESKIINDVISKGSKGIILYPVDTSLNMRTYSTLKINKYPLVSIDRSIIGLDTPHVSIDNIAAFDDITSHLIELGHKKITFVGTNVNSISSEMDRYRGFCQAHINHDLPLCTNHLICNDDFNSIPEDYHIDDDIQLNSAHYFFDILEKMDVIERPTAIACVNDELAQVLIKVANSRGINIPEDYAITGFDNLPFAAHLNPPLTTVDQHNKELGQLAASHLFKYINNPNTKPETKLIFATLIERKSSLGH